MSGGPLLRAGAPRGQGGRLSLQPCCSQGKETVSKRPGRPTADGKADGKAREAFALFLWEWRGSLGISAPAEGLRFPSGRHQPLPSLLGWEHCGPAWTWAQRHRQPPWELPLGSCGLCLRFPHCLSWVRPRNRLFAFCVDTPRSAHKCHPPQGPTQRSPQVARLAQPRSGRAAACRPHDPWGPRGWARRGLTPRGSLECNPEIPAFPGEEN